MLSTTLYSTSILIVASVLPQLQGALSAALDEISWAMTFNILATAVATPLSKEMVHQAALISYLNAFGMLAVASAVAIPLILMARLPSKKTA